MSALAGWARLVLPEHGGSVGFEVIVFADWVGMVESEGNCAVRLSVVVAAVAEIVVGVGVAVTSVSRVAGIAVFCLVLVAAASQ
jgi:hypothetical protein